MWGRGKAEGIVSAKGLGQKGTGCVPGTRPKRRGGVWHWGLSTGGLGRTVPHQRGRRLYKPRAGDWFWSRCVQQVGAKSDSVLGLSLQLPGDIRQKVIGQARFEGAWTGCPGSVTL